MNVTELYNELKNKFSSKFHFLKDKPEETIDSTLKACWHYASGNPMSSEKAEKNPLPELNEKQILLLEDLLNQRTRSVPLAHIIERQNFLGIELLSDKRALIPRKETEILGRKALELSLEFAKDKEMVRVMDICCGSGNLGLAIASLNPKVKIFASDLSKEAVELAIDNMNLLQLESRVDIKAGDLFSAFDNENFWGSVDLIICNPPYISTAKVHKMEEEIATHEPVLAFDGGMFGFKILQMLIEKAPTFLRERGWLVFEVGLGQGEFIQKLCARAGNYDQINPICDENGNTRAIAVRKNENEAVQDAEKI